MMAKPRIHVRGFTSFLVALSFVAMTVSGVVLYFTPRGRTANWTDWRLWSWSKQQWADVHTTTSVLFVLAAAVHLWLNWRVFWSYLRSKGASGLALRPEALGAAVLTAVVVTGTVLDWPPMSALVRWNSQIKSRWDRRAAAPPESHADELALEDFARQVGLTGTQAAEALRKEGFSVGDLGTTVGQIAAQKGVAPREVLAAIQRHYPDAGRGGGRGQGTGDRGQGAGRRREDSGQREEDGRGSGDGGRGGQGAGGGRGWRGGGGALPAPGGPMSAPTPAN